MPSSDMPQDLDRLLADADALIKRIDSHDAGNIAESDRKHFETHAQALRKRRSDVQEAIAKHRGTENGSPSEGMHEAIDDIVKAMKALGGFLS